MINMIEVNKSDILNILENEIGYSVNLKDGRFLVNNMQNYVSYFWSPLLEIEITDSMVSIGIPILMIKKNIVEILPGLLQLIQNNEIQLDDNEVHMVSMGKNLSLNYENGIYTVVDQFSRKISWGICRDGIYQNLIDIGWYLRNGS